jgi:hypothetical protein
MAGGGTERDAPSVPKAPTQYCSFCGKARYEVQGMVAGPAVRICDECVELCRSALAAERPRGQIALRVVQKIVGLLQMLHSQYSVAPRTWVELALAVLMASLLLLQAATLLIVITK